MPEKTAVTKLKNNKVTIKKFKLVAPLSLHHSRFDQDYEENKPQNWNTYHRSAFKKIPGVTIAQSRYQGNQVGEQNGMHAKAGTYYNPYAFHAYKKHVIPTTSDNSAEILPAYWYNRLLDYQKNSATYIVKKIKGLKLANITVNADYKYTCLLIKVLKPQDVKSDTDWANFLSLFLMAIINSLAAESGVNLEIHRRASFGFLRPAISECSPSIRINLGLCPKEYLNVIVDALKYLNILATNKEIFQGVFDTKHLDTIYTKYKELHPKAKTSAKNTLWENLWSTADSMGHSFIYQVFRKEHVIEYLVDLIFEECCNSSIEEIFKKTSSMKKAFATPFLKIFSAFKFTDKALSIDTTKMSHSTFTWPDARTIADQEFWNIFEELSQTLGAHEDDIAHFLETKTTNELYRFLDYLIQEFYFHPAVDEEDVADGYGSDSECEDDVDLDDEESCHVYSKKFITATGMRAIQMAYAVARTYLTQKHNVNPLSYQVSDKTMYYETSEAIKKHSIPLNLKTPEKAVSRHAGIAFFDNNFCNTQHTKTQNLLNEIQPGDYICIIDVTSATTMEMHERIKDIFAKKKVKLILLVSSGFKNEQSMSDLNPYGTIRIFALDQNDCDFAYDELVKLEKKANYLHPKTSHMLRLQAKHHGMTPTNKVILNPEEAEPSQTQFTI